MRKLIITVFLGGTLNIAGAQESGIHFENYDNWGQVLQKAKKEHKYIFVDCFATWCGPCKTMDTEVYPNMQVGDVYNKDFISVRLQMDRTSGDDAHVKRWYYLAKDFTTAYSIKELPTFLFFDEDGAPVHKATGLTDAKNFIQIAKDAQDPNRQYYHILKNFKPGKLKLNDEIGLASSFAGSDDILAHRIAVDYLNRIPKQKWNDSVNMAFLRSFAGDTVIRKMAKAYIAEMSEKDIFQTADRIYFVGTFTDLPSDRGFSLFYRHEAKINNLTKSKGFGHSVARHAIFKKEVEPTLILAMQSRTPPDWEKLQVKITKYYGIDYANWCIASGKINWFEHTKDWENYCSAAIDKINLSFKDSAVIGAPSLGTLNSFAFELFQYSNDKRKLEIALSWVAGVKETDKDAPAIMDTKASLLYKLGQKEEAIKAETEAVNLVKKEYVKYSRPFDESKNDYVQTLKKMEAGLPTW